MPADDAVDELDDGLGAASGEVQAVVPALGDHGVDVPQELGIAGRKIGGREAGIEIEHALRADRLFAPLAEAGINIDLVSTSEVRLNVVVAAAHGEQSLAVLRRAFGLPTAGDREPPAPEAG